ncbi:hypothetical protein [Hydrocarboniphaga effusa]|uniref:hypothetical protein n=1 Tax=Hydrocarboniphaga effusa TaxID=243629 RepID=UPI00398BF723
MREYGKVAPKFWTGETGKAIRGKGCEAQIVALYLMTNGHANMIGLYHLPIVYIAHETGLTFEGASKGLRSCIEVGFCSYDEASEHVFVRAMARFQIAESLMPNDKRCKGIQNELAKVVQGPLVKEFLDMYFEAFNLEHKAGKKKPLRSPKQAPSKPGAGAGAGAGAGDAAPSSLDLLKAEGVPEQIAEDWLKVRAKKRAAEVSKTVIDGVRREAKVAGVSFADAVRICVERNWQGFNAGWLGNQSYGTNGAAPPKPEAPNLNQGELY